MEAAFFAPFDAVLGGMLLQWHWANLWGAGPAAFPFITGRMQISGLKTPTAPDLGHVDPDTLFPCFQLRKASTKLKILQDHSLVMLYTFICCEKLEFIAILVIFQQKTTFPIDTNAFEYPLEKDESSKFSAKKA